MHATLSLKQHPVNEIAKHTHTHPTLRIGFVGSCYCCSIIPFSKEFSCGVQVGQRILLWGPLFDPLLKIPHKGAPVSPHTQMKKKKGEIILYHLKTEFLFSDNSLDLTTN